MNYGEHMNIAKKKATKVTETKEQAQISKNVTSREELRLNMNK
jgi:hypothetical protein